MKLWRILNIGLKSIKYLDMSEITSICFYSSGDRLFEGLLCVKLQHELMRDRHRDNLKSHVLFVLLPDACCVQAEDGGPALFCSRAMMTITSELV